MKRGPTGPAPPFDCPAAPLGWPALPAAAFVMPPVAPPATPTAPPAPALTSVPALPAVFELPLFPTCPAAELPAPPLMSPAAPAVAMWGGPIASEPQAQSHTPHSNSSIANPVRISTDPYTWRRLSHRGARCS